MIQINKKLSGIKFSWNKKVKKSENLALLILLGSFYIHKAPRQKNKKQNKTNKKQNETKKQKQKQTYLYFFLQTMSPIFSRSKKL